MKISNCIVLLVVAAFSDSYQLYCKCQCDNSKTIINKVDKCKQCTREFCLEKDPELCEVLLDSTGDSSRPNKPITNDNIIISCYQVESTKDAFIVYLFLLVILGLMLRILYVYVRGG